MLEEIKIREYAVNVLERLWCCIDFDGMSNSRKMGIWNEFSGKVKACANSAKNFEVFVEKMSKKIGIRSLDSSARVINDVSNLDRQLKKAILKLYREQLSIIMLEVRMRRDAEKEAYKAKKNKKEKESTINKLTDEQKDEFTNAFRLNAEGN